MQASGVPFLQMAAFETPRGESEKTVVVLNEAKDSANFVLYDGDELILYGKKRRMAVVTVVVAVAVAVEID